MIFGESAHQTETFVGRLLEASAENHVFDIVGLERRICRVDFDHMCWKTEVVDGYGFPVRRGNESGEGIAIVDGFKGSVGVDLLVEIEIELAQILSFFHLITYLNNRFLFVKYQFVFP